MHKHRLFFPGPAALPHGIAGVPSPAESGTCFRIRIMAHTSPPPPTWMHPVNGTGNSPSPGQPTLE